MQGYVITIIGYKIMNKLKYCPEVAFSLVREIKKL